MKAMKRTAWMTAGIAAASVGTASAQSLTLQSIGVYESGFFDESAAEIPAYDPLTQRLFVVNATRGIDILDIADPTAPTLFGTISAPGANSVSVFGDTLAIAVANGNTQSNGTVQFFDTAGNFRSASSAGALPDMVTFTPDGGFALAANEGEPNDDYDVDPASSISVIDVSDVFAPSVQQAEFNAFNGMEDALNDAGVRVFGPGASAAQDFEPEYVAVSSDSKTAYVALQENNAIAEVDIESATVTRVMPLGFKDHSLAGNGLDANKNDDAADIRNEPIFGMLQPDSISVYERGGETFIVTANEGDAREYDGFDEETDLKDVTLDPTAFSADFIARAGDSDDIGDLTITSTRGDTDGDGDFDEVYAFGGRSFSIFKVTDDGLEQAFDSGDAFEQITAATFPDDFNSDNDENDSLDSRSDNKGPEPEALALGTIGDKTIAFIGLERIGGIMLYDITDPDNAEFLDYINERDFAFEGDLEDFPAGAGDLGPEGLVFIDALDSPTGTPLLVAANEVSGTTRIFEVVPEPTSAFCMALAGGLLALRRRSAGRRA